MKKLSFLTVIPLMAALGCEQSKQSSVAAANSLMTEELFHEIVDRLDQHYRPIIAQHGAELVLKVDWASTTENASAPKDGNDWIINIFGGMARNEFMTPDGFALVLCHEMGHHLAGYPFKGSLDAASEAAADYYAAQVCTKELWRNDIQVNATFRDAVDPKGKELCDAKWQSEDEQNLCYRITMAGLSWGLFSGRKEEIKPSIATPDTTTVEVTNTAYPSAQCRLDTYVQGALCDHSFDHRIIPGRKTIAGKASLEAELEAIQNSCSEADGDKTGNRPRCWFNPRVFFPVDPVNVAHPGETATQVAAGDTPTIDLSLVNRGRRDVEDFTVSVQPKHSDLTSSSSSQSTGILHSNADIDFPTKLKVSADVECGTRLDYDLIFTRGDLRQAFTRSLRVGTLNESLIVEKSGTLAVFLGNGPEVEYAIDVDASDAEILFFDLNMVFFDTRYLTMSIESPAGTKFPLHNGEPGFDLFKAYEIKVPSGESASGQWKLRMKSNAMIAGVLTGLKVNAARAICN
ncbi:MAG: hypothetical protein AB7T49_10950 [Oligoflexales bacterium]